MKKLLLIAALAGLMSCSGTESEKGFTIKINVKGDLAALGSDTLLFESPSKEAVKFEPIVLENGKATVKGKVGTPDLYIFYVAGRGSFLRVFLENADYEMTIVPDTLRYSRISGGKVQDYLNGQKDLERKLSKEFNLKSMGRTAFAGSLAGNAELSQATAKFNKAMAEYDNAYVKANPLSPYLLMQFKRQIEKVSLDSAANFLAPYKNSPDFADNYILKKCLESVDIIRSLQPGNQVPDFIQNDLEGNPVKLSDIYSKNKVTLVDFWASWCRPCRAFNPTLLDIYSRYHGKGLEVLGVSLDQEQAKWAKAVEDDGLVWPHVSDLKGWDNAVAAKFHVESIPQNIIVDQDGKILARQANKEEIIRILEENL